MSMDIAVDGLVFTYPSGVTALGGITVSVPAGQRLAIVGQNGAGKTTLVRHFNGIFQPTEGTVRIGDWDTKGRDIAELAARVGYVFQNPDEQLFARSIRDEVGFGPKNLGVPADEIEARVTAALARSGLVGMEDTHPYHLSLSERKRVALASVLAMETPIVVLDEPTTGQDARGVALIGEVVAELAAEGRTVVAITHDMDFCAENFDRVLVMADGRVIADGTPAEAFSRLDALEDAHVEPPQLERLRTELGWAEPVMSVDEFVGQLKTRA
ncbi:MAG: ABC transporter ATP-binding protein [Schumannella sp.]|nr:ABC transporter ATP-binding protein [Microbacteriaceae bacterium]